jgi:hypothetical protein
MVSPDTKSAYNRSSVIESCKSKQYTDARSHYSGLIDKSSHKKESMRSTLTLVTKKPKEIPVKPVQSSVQVRNKIDLMEHQVDKFTINLSKKAHNSVLMDKSSKMQKQSDHSV